MLKVSRLNTWINKSYCAHILRSGLKSIANVYFSFFPINVENSVPHSAPPATPMTGNSVNSEQFFGKFFSHSPGRTDVLSNDTCSKFIIGRDFASIMIIELLQTIFYF